VTVAPLAGIRVLDLSWIIAGPLATRLLGDFGADVIKVESRTRMDVGRGNRVPLFGELPGDANTNPDTGGYFQDVNAGKRSCTLNLTTPAGRDLLRRLAVASDVVLCNLGGDQLERWGIGYDVLSEANPSVIVVNVPAMESDGPRSNWRGFGDTFVGVAGLKAVSGFPGEPPMPFGHQYADFSSNPFHAAIAIMAALEYRESTGAGQFIEISQYESTVALTGPAILEATATGEAPGRLGNQDADGAPHNFYRCKGDDAWCAIAVFGDAQWSALQEVSGIEALADPRFASAAERRDHAERIDELIEGWTRQLDKHEVAELLQDAGVPAGPYQNIEDMTQRDPLLRDHHFKEVEHPVGRSFLVHHDPIESSEWPTETSRAPLIGEHTYEVLSEVLELSADEIANFAAEGALE
jgi:benzylsuccinate CoA-transferase BbsF subunit